MTCVDKKFCESGFMNPKPFARVKLKFKKFLLAEVKNFQWMMKIDTNSIISHSFVILTDKTRFICEKTSTQFKTAVFGSSTTKIFPVKRYHIKITHSNYTNLYPKKHRASINIFITVNQTFSHFSQDFISLMYLFLFPLWISISQFIQFEVSK